MSNDGLSNTEKINLLFKNYMNFTSTLDSKPFYDETAVANNTNIFSNSVLSKMPSTNPSWTQVTDYTELESLLQNAGISNINIDASWFNAKTPAALGAKFEHSENRALRLTRIKLDYVTNGGASFICKDKNGTNILQNLIPSNYAQNGYSLDLEYKRPSDNAIKTIGWLVNRTELAGNVYVGEAVYFGGALFDAKSGVITFYDVDVNASTNFSGAEFYLTATKYIGPKLTDNDGNLYIDANVGIGTTNPGFLLDVYHPNQTFVNIGVGTGATNSSGSLQLIKGDNARIRTTGSDNLIFDTDSIERMRIKDTGDVGIGTNNPQYLLDLYNNTGDIMFQIRDNSTKLHIGTEVGSHAFIGVNSDDDLRFKTNNTDRIVIDNVGNVGIGTTNPQKLLDLSDNFSNGFRLGETLRSSIIDVANPGALTAGYNTAPISPSTSRLVGNEFSWTRGTVNNNFGNIAITYLSRPGDYLKITMEVKSSNPNTYFYIQNPAFNNLTNSVTVGSTSYVEKTLYVTIPNNGSFYSYFYIYGPDIQIKDFKIERIDMTLGGHIASTMAIVPPSNTHKFRALSLYNRNTSLHWTEATNYHFYVYDINNDSDDGNTRKMEICYDVDEDNTLMVFDGLNGNVGIGKMSAYPFDVTGGSRNRLLEQVGTFKIFHRRSANDDGTESSTYTPLNLFHNSDDMYSLWQNRNNIDYIAFPQATGDILYTHTIDIYSFVTGSSQVKWYKLQLRNAATGDYVVQTKFPIDSYHTIIAYKKKQGQPVTIEGDIGVDISSSDPSYKNYSQLSIQSISGTVHENIMALKIGADHKTNTGYLQTVNKFIGPGHLVLQPYAGNVGIGTDDPQELLHVGNYNATNDTYIKVQTGGSKKAGIQYVGGNTNIWHTLHDDNDNKFHVGLGTTGGNSEYLTIDSAGKVGIGTTNPSEALDISGNVRIRGSIFYIGNDFNDSLNFSHSKNSAGSESYSYIDYNDNGFLKFRSTPTGGSYKTTMTMDQSGNVGIGTNPSGKLDVLKSFSGVNNGHYAARIYGTDGGIGETGIRICEKGGGSLINNSTKALDVYANGSSKMVVTGAGNVGIGTDIPSATLDISGELKSKTVSIEPNGLVYDPNQSRPMGLVIANESTAPNEGFAALHLSNRGDPHTTARTIFQIDLEDITSGSGAGQRKIMFTGRTLTGTGSGVKKNFMTFDGNGGGVGIGAVGIGTEDGDTGSLIPGDSGYLTALNSIRNRVPRNTCQVYGNEGLTVSGTELTGSRTAVLRLGSPYQNNHDAYCAKITSTNNQSSTYAADLRFYTSAANAASAPERMCIATNGNVGIGTNIPSVPLHVKAGTSRSLTGGYYFAYNTNFGAYGTQLTGTAGGSAVNESILAEGGITSEAGFYADSDSRIKTNISDINDESALTKLREIEPKTYQYIDTIKRNNVTVYGFIAQQIKEVLPKAVTFQNRTIPSIFELCNATSSSNNEYYDTIHFTDFNTANLDASSNNLVIVDANNEKHAINILSVLDSSSVQIDTDLSEWMGAIGVSNETVIANEVQKYEKVILDANNIVVLENYDITSIATIDASDNVVGNKADLTGDNTIDSSNNYVDASGNFIAGPVNSDGHYIDASGNYFDADGNFKDASNNLIGTYKTEWKKVTIHGTKIFVYGQTVNDFHVLQKEYIFTVATAALQEVDRQLQAEKAKTATLESQVADLLARVTALESA